MSAQAIADVPLPGVPLLYLLASIGNLAIAIVVIFRARGVVGAMPLTLLCLALFVWELGECATRLFEADHHWRYVRLIGSSMAPAFLFHFAVHRVRRERAFQRTVWLLYGISLLFALMTGGALYAEKLKEFVDSNVWNMVYLALLFPFVIVSVVLVARRLGEVTDRGEKNVLNLIALGIGIGAVTGLNDLTVVLGGPLPPLGHIGSVMMTLVLAVAITRHRLLESDIPFGQINLVAVVAAAAVIVNFLLYTLMGGRSGDLLILGTAVLTVVVLAVYRLVLGEWYGRREHRRRLALLGSMAASLAHEVRNPLASIKGAAQYVERELESPSAESDSREYLKMLVEEVDRLDNVVESFLNYARPLEPKLQKVEIAKLVRDLAAAQEGKVECEAAGSPVLSADPDLLRHAIGNLLRNARQAAGPGGSVRVRVREVAGRRPQVAVEVEDDGPGIPRDRIDEIFEPFVTTKTRGTGLGLAIARRIAEGHGGSVRAANAGPRGALFTLLLPSGS